MSAPENDPIRDAAETVLGDHCTPEALAAWDAGALPEALWRDLDETGLLSLLLSEEAGGIGADAATFAAILRLAGRVAAPGPLAETCVGRWLAEAAGLPVPEGALSVSTCWRIEGGRLQGGGAAPGGAGVQTVVLLCDEALALVPAAAVGATTRINLAGEARLAFPAEIAAPGLATLPPGIASRAGTMLSLGRLAMILGALDRVLALSLEHASTRVQFGRPIGKFQAVQQNLAVLAGGVGAAAAAVGAAARETGAGGSGLLLAAARARLGEIAVEAAAIAHQVHGAIGTTRDYELQFHTRRLAAWRLEQGSPRAARQSLARTFAGTAQGLLWEKLLATA